MSDNPFSEMYQAIVEAHQRMKANDPRPFGPQTVYIINAHTWSLMMYESWAKREDYYIRERVRINGEWIPVKVGEVLAVHEDQMYEITGGEAYWGYRNACVEANHSFMRGEITIEQFLTITDEAREDYEESIR